MSDPTDITLPITPAKIRRAVEAIVEEVRPRPRGESCTPVAAMENRLTAYVGDAVQAAYTDADYVFSWFVLGSMCGNVDRLGHFGREFDPANPHHTTMTVLVKTELAQAVGFTPPEDKARVGGEDWRFTLGCVAAGAKIVHLPERTWTYSCLPGNTSGLPDRW